MTEKASSTTEKPRDVYGGLVLTASHACGIMWAGVRPAVDAGGLFFLQRGEIESQVAMRAATGSRSGWWAVAKLIGLSAALLAVHGLLWQGVAQVQIVGGAMPGQMGGAVGFAVQILASVLAQVLDARLWIGALISFMVMRFFASAMWCSELKLLPLSASSVAAHIVAVLFVAACVYHLLTYVGGIVYWLAVIHLSQTGSSYEFLWPWVVLIGPLYGVKPTASVPQILVQELMGHSFGVAYNFLSLVLVAVLSMRLRHVVTTAIVWAVLSAGLMWGYYLSLRPVHTFVQWIAQNFLPGDPGVMVGNVSMWLIGIGLMLIVTGLLCRLLDRRLLGLMEE